MDGADEGVFFEEVPVDVVRVPPPTDLERSPETRYIYVDQKEGKFRIFYSSDCKGPHRERNAQLEWARTHGYDDFTRIRWVGRTNVKLVRVLAVDVVHSMLKSEHRGLVRPQNGRPVDVIAINSLLDQRFPASEKTGPTSPFMHIFFDPTRKLFVWKATKTPHLWHLQVGDAAFSSLLRAIRALKTGSVEGGPTPSKVSARPDDLKYSSPSGLRSLKALLDSARDQMKLATPVPVDVATPSNRTEKRVASPPPAIVPVVEPSRPTTGGKGLVTNSQGTPKLTASTTFGGPSESESEDDSEDEPATQCDNGNDEEDQHAEDLGEDSTMSESDYSSDDDMHETPLRPVLMPLDESEPVVGLKRAADALVQNYLVKIHAEGRLGPSPDRSHDEVDRYAASGLQGQIQGLAESIQITRAQIASHGRMIEMLKRKLEIDYEVYGELHGQLQTAKRRCALPSDEYVLSRAAELRRMQVITEKRRKAKLC